MSEDIKAGINEILDDVDQLLTEEYIEGVTLWDLVLESLSEVVEERIMYGNNEYNTEDNKANINANINELLDDSDRVLTERYIEEGTLWDSDLESFSEAFARIESGKRYVAEDMNSLASLMEHFSKSGHSVAEWAEATYGVSPITGDSLTEVSLSLTNKTEKRVRPGERCDTCSNMTKKELKKYDSCPSCGRSLFALKSRGW